MYDKSGLGVIILYERRIAGALISLELLQESFI
jgi:hypothetical protein